ncbi:MAG: hypothetical protein ACOYO1_00755 [Bacteroidales bacterium]
MEALQLKSLKWMANTNTANSIRKKYYYHLGILQERKAIENKNLVKSEELISKLNSINQILESKEVEIRTQTEFLVNITKDRISKGELKITDLDFENKISFYSRNKYKDDDILCNQPFFTLFRLKSYNVFGDPDLYNLKEFLEYFDDDKSIIIPGIKYMDSINVCSTLQILFDETYLTYKDISDFEDIVIEVNMKYLYNFFIN